MIITSLQISLCILAIYACTRDGMILGKLRAYIQTLIDKIFGVEASEWVCKPLFECITCMASVWGIIGCIVFGVSLIDWPVTILMVCGINVIFKGLNNEKQNQ